MKCLAQAEERHRGPDALQGQKPQCEPSNAPAARGKRADDAGSQAEAQRPGYPGGLAGGKRSDDDSRTSDLYHEGHE